MDIANIPGAFAQNTLTDPFVTAATTHNDELRQAVTVAAPSVKTELANTTASPSSETPAEVGGKEPRSRSCNHGSDAEQQCLRLRSSRTWKAKGADMLNEKRERKRPLSLLDLPVDVLKEIVSAVTHTNDLTSLARCHSALHRLAIPPLFSKFDIIWPMETSHAEPRSGVDALTYGLATLVMAEEVFRQAPVQRGRATESMIRRRRGNHYAQYTKKFSLGNGPADWVQEYLITKEGGKMLGTLVALAVARMRSLESFIWDMPTGVLRDVWMALSSLADHQDGQCRLQKVWIRWHDNTPIEVANPAAPYAAPPAVQHSSVQPPLANDRRQHVLPEDLDHVEHPSFSILPALKSLSVLDIDELAYLDEIAVLIERSLSRLEELRIGIARHASSRDWVVVEEGEELQQVDYDNPTAGSLTIGEKRLGGVLGTLTGFIHDMRQPLLSSASPQVPLSPRISRSPLVKSAGPTIRDTSSHNRSELPPTSSPARSPERAVLVGASQTDADGAHSSSTDGTLDQNVDFSEDPISSPASRKLSDSGLEREDLDAEVDQSVKVRQQHQLTLGTLELERVPLSIDVLLRAFDWSRLTCLTILHCQNHEALWKKLRQEFAPVPRSPQSSPSGRSATSSPKKGSRSSHPPPELDMLYPLRLKRIHTNTVSPALIHFLRETLAPNTLETLFLQEVRSYPSNVSIEAIFKGPLRRHRTSLVKVLIDSSEKGPDGIPTNSSRWRRWMLTREILTFICSGKMPRLRELGMAIEYRDWHFFLQRLPSIPHLRSLFIPFLADHVHGADVDPRELALQIVDIVALRPEVELCYIGIANKCFEILETKHVFDMRAESHLGHNSVPFESSDPEEDAEDGEDDIAATVDGDENEELDDDGTADDTESDASADDEASDVTESSNQARLRLREILFYDDKVAVFRARHGRL